MTANNNLGFEPGNWKFKTVSAICMLLILLFYALSHSSCNPVRRVLLDDEKYKIVTDKFVSEGGCVNDTIFSSDTTVLLDTLYSLDFKTDTVYIDDVKTVVRTEFKTVEKRVIIRDTAVVTDNSRINLLQKEVSKHLEDKSKLNEKIVSLQDDLQAQKKKTGKWKLYFWIILIVSIAIQFRKPILRLISPLKF